MNGAEIVASKIDATIDKVFLLERDKYDVWNISPRARARTVVSSIM